jgi:hypothetical protein
VSVDNQSLSNLAVDWSGPNPPTLLSAIGGPSGEMFVSSIQFHDVALPPEALAGMGGVEHGPMPSVDTSIGLAPGISSSLSNNIVNMSWLGGGYVLQEAPNLTDGAWLDSYVPFEQTQTNGVIATTAHATADRANKFYRLVFRP